MPGAIPSLPQYDSIAWCSVKKRHRDSFKSIEQNPKKLIVIQLIKKFLTFYGTRRFITEFARARHWFLS
jgi:hypothetical protein